MPPLSPDGVQWITPALFQDLLERAAASPRRRLNLNFHQTPEENPHRFLNVLLRGTYIQPHRHRDPPKAESFLVLEGEVLMVLFDDEGRITHRQPMGLGTGTLAQAQTLGVDLPPGVWHTLVVLSPHAFCFEVKPGPYVAANDKEFAPWAPPEGDPAAPAYLRSLLDG